MRILAVDVGCKTGWAASVDGTIESGVHKFELDRGESPGIRFLRFNAWLDNIFAIIKPDMVIAEQAHHRGGYATDVLVGMLTRLQEKCAKEKVEYMSCHSATLKKFATGSGRADKVGMMKAAWERRPGYLFKTDDEADAYLLLCYAKVRIDQ